MPEHAATREPPNPESRIPNPGEITLTPDMIQRAGIKTVYSKVFPAEVSSYKGAADQVAATGAQMVVLGSPDIPAVSAFMKAFEQQHYNPKVFAAASGPDGGQEFLNAVGMGNATGIMVPNGWYGSYANPRTLRIDPLSWTAGPAGTPDAPTITGPTSTPQPTRP